MGGPTVKSDGPTATKQRSDRREIGLTARGHFNVRTASFIAVGLNGGQTGN